MKRSSSRSILHSLRERIKTTYNRYIRPRFPVVEEKLNGVRTPSSRLFDSVIPWLGRHDEEYEDALVDQLNLHVRAGDHVVVVGGGWGVTAVVAARSAGPEGRVTVFEAGNERYEGTARTINRNPVPADVNIVHAVVGESKFITGSEKAASHTSPRNLPACDVLELDCEGSEREILENLACCPRVIIVETHGHLGCPPATARELLESHGYEVVDERVAEKRKIEFCQANGIFVLTALYRDEVDDPTGENA